MSHRAVNWALEQRHLKPGPWIVLIQLADRHNKDTGRVSPYQATLAADCNMPRSSINNHLDALEDLGLLRRVQRVNPITKRQLGTFYVLALDFENPPEIDCAVSKIETRDAGDQTENIGQSRVQNPDTGAVSKKPQKPCPKNGDSRVRILDSMNLVKEPGKEPCVAEGPTHTDLDFSRFVDCFIAEHPRPGDRDLTEDALRKAIEAGVDPEQLIRAAKSYRAEQRGNKRQYVAYAENWLAREGWKKHEPKKPVDRAAIDEATAKLIRSGKRYLCGSITAVTAGELVERQLVTVEECQAVGVI